MSVIITWINFKLASSCKSEHLHLYCLDALIGLDTIFEHCAWVTISIAVRLSQADMMVSWRARWALIIGHDTGNAEAHSQTTLNLALSAVSGVSNNLGTWVRKQECAHPAPHHQLCRYWIHIEYWSSIIEPAKLIKTRDSLRSFKFCP